jgi:hypothetical protein
MARHELELELEGGGRREGEEGDGTAKDRILPRWLECGLRAAAVLVGRTPHVASGLSNCFEIRGWKPLSALGVMAHD